jgi:cytochrome c oxidase cbb3-type subunit 3
MADQYKDEVLDHEYDGILEYDNPMPGWWVALFVLTVIWAGVYVVGIGFGKLPEYGDDLRAGQQELAEMRLAYERSQPPVVIDEASLLAAAEDPAQIASGGEVYTTYCASCHGDLGQGMVGPNLTDDHWLHGNKAMQIHAVVRDGVDGKGMPAWGSIITPKQSIQVVAYVTSLHGTNPANPKAPEGERIAPAGDEPAPEVDDAPAEAPTAPAPADAPEVTPPADAPAEAPSSAPADAPIAETPPS